MVRIVIDIPPKQFSEIKSTLADWYGIEVTDKYLGTLLKSHPDLAAEIHMMGFDTAAREMLVERIGRELTDGMIWPINGDSSEYKKEFYDKFKDNIAKTSGIKWEIEDYDF